MTIIGDEHVGIWALHTRHVTSGHENVVRVVTWRDGSSGIWAHVNREWVKMRKSGYSQTSYFFWCIIAQTCCKQYVSLRRHTTATLYTSNTAAVTVVDRMTSLSRVTPCVASISLIDISVNLHIVILGLLVGLNKRFYAQKVLWTKIKMASTA